MQDELVLGLDVGGTHTRAMLGDLTGRVRGTGDAAGGNPNSHSPAEAVTRMSQAARSALGDIDPSRVQDCVVGMAGVTRMSDPDFRALFHAEWSQLGLSCAVTAISDAEVAFAAGTPEPDGVVLIAGTGSIAVRISQHRAAAHADGWGWLLGDEGSAFWLGRQALRATLRTLDQGAKATGLAAAVCAQLDAHDRNSVITAANSRPPIQLAELAPLVEHSDDPAAEDIIQHGAELLADTAAAAVPGDNPIVLAGGLLTPDSRIGRQVRAELAARGFAIPLTAGPGAAGATWLAARPHVADPRTLHTMLLSSRQTI